MVCKVELKVRMTGAVEILGGRERRRRWGVEEKLRIVAETQEAGACVRAVAARHDVYPSLLHYWRRQLREGRLVAPSAARFVPVRVAEADPRAAGASLPSVNDPPATAIEIVFPDGCRLRFGSEVSLPALRRAVTALRG
ncbi:MAG: transposase [Acetobacteraceae bacterium]